MNPGKVNIALRGVETIVTFDSATLEEADGRLILRDAEGGETGQFFLDAVAGWWFEEITS
jgi:hypothetical protein